MITAVGDLVEDIVVFPHGEVRPGTDTSARVERHRGGSAANVAVAAAIAGGRSRFVGNVGKDALGDRLIAEMRAWGVAVEASRNGRTGSIVALVDAGGERSFLTDRGAADDLHPIPRDALVDTTVLHVPLYSLMSDPLRRNALTLISLAREQGALVSLDASSTGALLDYGVDAMRMEIMELAPTVLFCNGPEAQLLGASSGELAATTIVKNGGDPTVVLSARSRNTHAVLAAHDIVDTTGAGDAFAGAYLVSRFEQSKAEDVAIAAAQAMAARTLSSFGATPSGVQL